MISRIFVFFIILQWTKGFPSSAPFDDRYPELGKDYQGDILNDPNTFDLMRGGIDNERARWPEATLVYTIAPGFTATQLGLIRKAMDEIRNNTCIRFKQGMSGDYVLIQTGNGGCSSYVGRQGGRQPLNLASACFRVGHGTAMHEMIHALGFFHEQSRSDRDDFVTINWERIWPMFWSNFRRERSVNFEVPYDYGSIMHYPKDAFAIVPLNAPPFSTTIQTRNSAASSTIGQRKALSDKDIVKLNRMYKCPGYEQ